MKWTVRIVLSVLSIAFGLYAIRELIGAETPIVGVMALLMLLMAVAGVLEALRTHPRE